QLSLQRNYRTDQPGRLPQSELSCSLHDGFRYLKFLDDVHDRTECGRVTDVQYVLKLTANAYMREGGRLAQCQFFACEPAAAGPRRYAKAFQKCRGIVFSAIESRKRGERARTESGSYIEPTAVAPEAASDGQRFERKAVVDNAAPVVNGIVI